MLRTLLACAVAALGMSLATSDPGNAACTNASISGAVSGDCSLTATNTSNLPGVPSTGPFGDVSWSTNAGDTTLTLVVTLLGGLFIHQGADFGVDASVSTGSVLTVTSGTGFATGTGSVTAGGNIDGMGSFAFALDCTSNGATGCGTSTTIVITDTGGTFTDMDANARGNTFAIHVSAADGSCTGFVGGAGTSSGSTANGSCSSSAVPAPLAGAGLPGLIAGCLGLFALARRRRQQLVA